MAGRVLIVGDVMNDILVVPQGAIARGTDTPATIQPMPGGSGANQAVWLAAMGVDAHFAGRVGASDVQRLTRHFEGQGVAAHLAGDEGYPTGTLICLVDGDGERSFLTDRGANARLRADDLPEDRLDELDWLHVSGYALFEPGPRAAILAFIAQARRRDIPVSLDPASTGFLTAVSPSAFLDWIEGVDTIFPNADEAALLTGRNDVSGQMASLLQRFPRVVLKRGAEGAICAGRNISPVALPAERVDVLDTTGAGDAFLAGFLAAQLHGEDHCACLQSAITAGARAVQRLGAQPR